MKNYNIDTLKKAIKGSGGLYTQIAKKLGCNWYTAKKYVEGMPDAVIAFQDEREGLLDLTEARLIQNIKDGDNTAIIFYLKTQGKHRGYIERVEQDHKIAIDNRISQIEFITTERK